MPPTDEIPEPPRHILHVTGEEEPPRYVTSDHPEIWPGLTHHQYVIIRCGVCGHDATSRANADHEARIDHEHHFESRHVGAKVVWRLRDVADTSLADLSRMTRRRFCLDDDAPDYVRAVRGDIPDEKARELAREHLDDDDPIVIVHQPPTEPYTGSVEEGATEGVYVA